MYGTEEAKMKEFLANQVSKERPAEDLKAFIKAQITTPLVDSAEKLLEDGQRHPWQLAKARKEWTPPGTLTHDVETEIMRIWFGDEDSVGELELPEPRFFAVAHSVVQAIFDKSKKKYNQAMKKRDKFREDAKEVWNGE
jgi:hypothetical protein